MIKPEQKKIAFYSFLILLIVGLSIHIYKTRKEVADRQNYIEKSLMESNIFDKKIWDLKDVSLAEISTDPETQCQNLSVLFRIELQQSCYENLSQTKSFWEKNIVMEKIINIFKNEEDKAAAEIYREGNCITEDFINKSIVEETTLEYEKIGSTECLESRHTIFGGGCKLETVVTKESIDEMMEETRKSLVNSLKSAPQREKGYSVPMLYDAKYCKESAKGKKSLSLIKTKE